DEAALAQLSERLAHDGAADAELLCDHLLGRKPGPDLELAGEDPVLHPPGERGDERVARERLDLAEAPRRSAPRLGRALRGRQLGHCRSTRLVTRGRLAAYL